MLFKFLGIEGIYMVKGVFIGRRIIFFGWRVKNVEKLVYKEGELAVIWKLYLRVGERLGRGSE